MSCKHPIEKIATKEEIEYGHDDYGSMTQDVFYYLSCKKCKKKLIMYRATVEIYEKLTGRELDTEEAKKLFKKNNELFHELDLDEKLRKSVMSNPQLEKKLEKKRKDIIKQEIEYFHMLKKYRGGTLDQNSHVKLQTIDGTFDEILSIFKS